MGVGGQIPIGGFGITPITSVASDPKFAPDAQFARVSMVGQAQAVVGVADPILAEALRASQVRKCSGKAENFEDFEREWNFHLKLMHGASRGTLPDAVVLMTLKKYLDEASAEWLLGKMAIDPDLPYYEFWDELKGKFLRDARATHRQNWLSVKLSTSGSTANLQEWSKFQALYTSKRTLVEDWSDAEDQKHVFSQVPPTSKSKCSQRPESAGMINYGCE